MLFVVGALLVLSSIFLYEKIVLFDRWENRPCLSTFAIFHTQLHCFSWWHLISPMSMMFLLIQRYLDLNYYNTCLPYFKNRTSCWFMLNCLHVCRANIVFLKSFLTGWLSLFSVWLECLLQPSSKCRAVLVYSLIWDVFIDLLSRIKSSSKKE